VFAGSFDLAAAEALCAGGPLTREDILPTLIGLVDKSVVLRTEEDAARSWLLDTIREFGAERLARLPADAAQDALGEDCYTALFRDGAGRPLDLVVTLVVTLAVTDADELPATPGRQRPASLLTGRERKIAALVGEGMSNRDIAQQLGISKRTVDAHVEHIFGNLGISSRVQLATGLSPTALSPDRPQPPPGPPGP